MKHFDYFSTIKQKAGYLLLLAVSLGPWKTSLITNSSDTHAYDVGICRCFAFDQGS